MYGKIVYFIYKVVKNVVVSRVFGINNKHTKLFTGGKKMNKTQKYEEYKKYLQSLNLSYDEYERRIREWCKRNNY